MSTGFPSNDFPSHAPGVSDHGYLEAKRYGDLVMKGGITSGILYPPCACELARDYYFKSIGGTSAGAIAAVFTAAAEYRRRYGSEEGFHLLALIPDQLGENDNLLQIFRPDRSTRKTFQTLLAIHEAKGWRKLLTLWRLPGLLWQRPLRKLVKNGYGLCSGMARSNLEGTFPPLGVWLAETLDHIAGLEGERPLTFGDLWDAPDPFEVRRHGGHRGIDLRTVTTCVTLRRPFAVPFETKIFTFKPAEWKEIFPERIVRFMVEHPYREPKDEEKALGLVPLPKPEDMPVVVAARLSLSFPGLVSMVPLWAVDHELDEEKPKDKKRKKGSRAPSRCWFSDGGITSNFPMHFFDALAPRWPTFGINLQYMDEDEPPGRRALRRTTPPGRIWLPKRRQDGLRDLFHDFEPGTSPRAQLLRFLGAVFSSAQNWYDNAYLRHPAYRERVVEIWLSKGEGGLNLHMGPEVIERLIGLGAEAGRQLRDQFNEPGAETGWEAHRWARMRSSLAALAESLDSVKTAFEDTLPGDRSFFELMRRPKEEPPRHYHLDKRRGGVEQRDAAVEAVKTLREAIEAWQEFSCAPDSRHGPFCDPPRPTIKLGSQPKM